MHVRLTYVNVLPGRQEDVRKIYYDEIMPAVKKQPGCLDIMLLEPANVTEDFISCTMWQTKADADAYDSSGNYQKMVDKVRNLFSKTPVLKTYEVAEIAKRQVNYAV
jgi:heme-degrading monooxygenase HmoA